MNLLIIPSYLSPSLLIKRELEGLLNEKGLSAIVCAFIGRTVDGLMRGELVAGELVAITAKNLGGTIYVIGQIESISQFGDDNTKMLLLKKEQSLGVIALNNESCCSITPEVAQMIEQYVNGRQ
jgi:hypothetical protein